MNIKEWGRLHSDEKVHLNLRRHTVGRENFIKKSYRGTLDHIRFKGIHRTQLDVPLTRESFGGFMTGKLVNDVGRKRGTSSSVVWHFRRQTTWLLRYLVIVRLVEINSNNKSHKRSVDFLRSNTVTKRCPTCLLSWNMSGEFSSLVTYV